MKAKKKPKEKQKTGPEAERVKIDGDWKAAVKTSFAKKKPAKGWPK